VHDLQSNDRGKRDEKSARELIREMLVRLCAINIMYNNYFIVKSLAFRLTFASRLGTECK
jgi:hypothetical protein